MKSSVLLIAISLLIASTPLASAADVGAIPNMPKMACASQMQAPAAAKVTCQGRLDSKTVQVKGYFTERMPAGSRPFWFRLAKARKIALCDWVASNDSIKNCWY